LDSARNEVLRSNSVFYTMPREKSYSREKQEFDSTKGHSGESPHGPLPVAQAPDRVRPVAWALEVTHANGDHLP